MPNLWPPFIDDGQSGSLDTTSTTYVTVASRTVTPRVNCRLMVCGMLGRLLAAGNSAPGLARINATGTGVTVQSAKEASIAPLDELSTMLIGVIDVTAGSTATVTIEMKVGIGGDTVRAIDTGTSLNIFGLPLDGTSY